MSKYEVYSSYSDSNVEWLGEIPEHWSTSTLKFQLENLDFRRIPISASERGDIQGVYPYYGASGIIDYVEDYIFNEKTILIGEDGANLLSKSTPLAFIADGKYWVNNHAHILKPKDKLFNFWTYILNNLDLTPVISGSAQPKLTAEALGNLVIVFPKSINERTLISTYLDIATAKIDTLIEKQTKLIELLKEKRQAVISTAVTRGLDSTVAMKDSGVEWLGEIPEHWEVKPAQFIAKITRGAILRPVDAPEYFEDDGEWAYLNISDATKCDKYLSDSKLKLSKLGSMKSARVYPNNVIITASATIGKAFINKIKVCVHDGFIPFTEIKVYKDYLYHYLSNPFLYAAMGKSNTQKNIYLDEVKRMMVTVPPMKEQVEIVEYLEAKSLQMNNLIDKATKAIDLLKEKRTALISAVVTGKIDVREEV